MELLQKNSSRKKFLLWATAVLSSLAVLKIFSLGKKKKTDTVKMLTQDGRLVEIDKTLLAASGKKITNEELQKFIKK